MKSTDANYQEVLTQFQQVWNDKKMVDYCIKKTQIAVKLTDGYIICFDKPSIETRFCFGWNTFDEEGQEAASKCAYGLGKKKSYFMSRNLGTLENDIDFIKKSRGKMHIFDNYSPDINLKNFVILSGSQDLWKYSNPCESSNEKADREIILEALESIKADFTKRLERWWKRYGSDHIRTWTYCCDD